MKRAPWLAVLALVLAPLMLTARGNEGARAAEPQDLAHDLAMLATGMPASTADLARLQAAGNSSEAYSRYVDELLTRPQLANVASRVLRLIGSNSRTLLGDGALKQQGAIYYIHEPCDASAAVTVKPWWDLGTVVKVCPDSYRPEVFKAPDGNYCSGVYAAPYQPKSPCGCGPNLMRCSTTEQKAQIAKAITAEATGSIAWVINHNLPLETLFTSAESFRLPLVEFLYQRWRVENRDVPSLEALPDWRKWPTDGAWAKRPESRPDQHAGLFTNHFTPQAVDSIRLKVSGFLDTLWCEDQDSLRVKTATVLEVADQLKGNLRSHVGWEELAARPLCTTCHARIDYGVQFFSGVQWFFKAQHYVKSEQQDVEGALYLRDIEDPRGKAKRNPQGFVKLAMAQPEYKACMAKDLMVHAFGSATEPTLGTLDDALQAVVERKGTFRDLMKVTLERYKDRSLAAKPAPRAPVPTHDSAKLVADMVKDRCDSCHDADDGEPTALILKHGAKWCQVAGSDCARLGVEILSAVAFDRMPKRAPLAAADKRRLFELVAPLAWSNPGSRAMAERYFLDYGEAPAVHSTDAMLGWIKAQAPATKVDLPGLPQLRSFSTTNAVQTAIVAAKVCATAPDRAACLEQAMDSRSFEK
ncbi:MAG: hypothetical protein WKG01_03340 [Kofleriaceae bacterium]